MAFCFLSIFTFFMFFQPGIVFPELAHYHPYRFAAVIAIISYFLVGNKSGSHFLSNKYVKYFLLFIGIQVLSSSMIWLSGGISTFNIWINTFIIFFLIVKSCTNEKRIITILLMMILGILYLSYYSISNVMVCNQPRVHAQGFGLYEGTNDLVLILITVIPLAFCLGEYLSHRSLRYLFQAIAVLFSFNILLSASREGLLGLLVVGSLSLLFSKKISRSFRIIMSVALLVSVLTIGIVTVLTRDDLAGNLIGDSSSRTRIIQWKACLRMVKDHPLLGVGPGESRYLMRDYGGIQGYVPHNTLVQVFAETGIIGGIFFCLFSCYPLWEAWKFYKNNREKIQIPAVIIYNYLVIALCGFWCCAFFSNRVYFDVLYVLIALIIAVRENCILPIENTVSMQ